MATANSNTPTARSGAARFRAACMVIAAALVVVAGVLLIAHAVSSSANPTAIETVCGEDPAWGGYPGDVIYAPNVTYFGAPLTVGQTYKLVLSHNYDPRAVYPIRDIISAIPLPSNTEVQVMTCPPPPVHITGHHDPRAATKPHSVGHPVPSKNS